MRRLPSLPMPPRAEESYVVLPPDVEDVGAERTERRRKGFR